MTNAVARDPLRCSLRRYTGLDPAYKPLTRNSQATGGRADGRRALSVARVELETKMSRNSTTFDGIASRSKEYKLSGKSRRG
jgi:hypothetical protein